MKSFLAIFVAAAALAMPATQVIADPAHDAHEIVLVGLPKANAMGKALGAGGSSVAIKYLDHPEANCADEEHVCRVEPVDWQKSHPKELTLFVYRHPQ